MTRMQRLRGSLECDPVRMCEILVGLPDVEVIGLDAGGLVLERYRVMLRAELGLEPTIRLSQLLSDLRER